ncbi:Protein Asterix [Araneus ventricosus]|uniref:Protein Asterix n=1 Tax=Araneus ventricosus TaxID=182803 RepID=A0A4Y2FAX4_ARAVE|nr:Protein Asterix [Araneus ventricosus]
MPAPNVNNSDDPKRPDAIHRYQFPTRVDIRGDAYFTTQELFDVFAILLSMFGLFMKLTWCTWVALFCSTISFAHSQANDDTKEVFYSFMMSISAVVMSYLQNPQPMTFSDFASYTW